MDQQRSSQAVEKYRQHKLNASIFSRIRQLLRKFEEDARADRRLAWLGIALLIGVIAVGLYLFGTGSDITISP